MKTNLTKEQINYYQENGYIIIHEFLKLPLPSKTSINYISKLYLNIILIFK